MSEGWARGAVNAIQKRRTFGILSPSSEEEILDLANLLRLQRKGPQAQAAGDETHEMLEAARSPTRYRDHPT